MSLFPRTVVGGLSVSRMIAGSNWFLGWSHCTPAKDNFIRDYNSNRKSIADILEVFFNSGVDTVMGLIEHDCFYDGIRDAEQRTGVKANIVSTPSFTVNEQTPAGGFDMDEVNKTLEIQAKRGTAICMPHMNTTDKVIDGCTRKLRHMDSICRAIREHGMLTGLSTHMPESIVFADESGLDVDTYISIYNAMGFLMQVEVDWISKVIRDANKPVMTIKPMAAGQIRPFQAMTFVWNSLREQDMVTVGTMTPDEARELIDLSLQILDQRVVDVKLQETRSKASIKK